MARAYKRTGTSEDTIMDTPYIPTYFLNYVAEDSYEREIDFQAATDEKAIDIAKVLVAGTEGLWSAITLVREDGKELPEPSDGWR